VLDPEACIAAIRERLDPRQGEVAEHPLANAETARRLATFGALTMVGCPVIVMGEAPFLAINICFASIADIPAMLDPTALGAGATLGPSECRQNLERYVTRAVREPPS